MAKLKTTNNSQPDMWYSYSSGGGNATYDLGGVVGASTTPYHDLAHISDLEFVAGATKSSETTTTTAGEKGLVRVLEPYVINFGEDTDYQMNKLLLHQVFFFVHFPFFHIESVGPFKGHQRQRATLPPTAAF